MYVCMYVCIIISLVLHRQSNSSLNSFSPENQQIFTFSIYIRSLEDMTIDKGTEWEIVHIPDKPPIPPHLQPTVYFYAAVIDPKQAHTLVRKLNQIAPLESFRHVKRIRKQQREGGIPQLSVILCLVCDNDPDCIPDSVSELIKLYQLDCFVTKVCKFAPLSKEEWEEQCKLWPTSYHPPTYNIDGITGFNEVDSQYVLDFMKLAVHMARFSESQVVNAAIIVDPSTKKVIARAYDKVFSETPLRKQEEEFSSESRFCDTDKDASLNSNGRSDLARQSSSGVSCLAPWNWAKQKSCTQFCHPLKHAAMVAIEKSASRDRQLFPGSEATGENHTQMENLETFSAGSPIKKQKISIDAEDEDKEETRADGFDSANVRPYLCTGYDIFIVWEPCVMCAMALVHQRVRRIFYAFPNPNDGALGSVHRLQGEKSLNHHYAVFRVLIPEKILEEMNPNEYLNKICHH